MHERRSLVSTVQEHAGKIALAITTRRKIVPLWPPLGIYVAIAENIWLEKNFNFFFATKNIV